MFLEVLEGYPNGADDVISYNWTTLHSRCLIQFENTKGAYGSLDTNLHHDFEDNRSKCYGAYGND
jgi:hypothetical protein